jgi:glucose-6-phosphate 1-dehydrogenase
MASLHTTSGNGQPGYLEDPTVPEGSRAPTYAACRLQINNERWAGVPFVLRAGKALNERSVVVRIQLHENPVPLFGPHGTHQQMRNEFVMRLQPGGEFANERTLPFFYAFVCIRMVADSPPANPATSTC